MSSLRFRNGQRCAAAVLQKVCQLYRIKLLAQVAFDQDLGSSTSRSKVRDGSLPSPTRELADASTAQ